MPRADWQRNWRKKVRHEGRQQVAVYLDEREVALLDAVAFAVLVAYPELGGADVPQKRVPSRAAALRIVLQAILGGIPAPQRDETVLAMHWVRLASWAAWRRDRGDAPPGLQERPPETAHEAAAAARATAQLLRTANQVLERIGLTTITDEARV